MAYVRRTRKTARKPRYKKRTMRTYRKRRTGRSGYLSTVRWSNRDTGNYCHFTISGSAGGTSTIMTTTFNLSDVAGSNEFTALFDNYCIKKVLYRWILRRDPAQGSTPGVPPRVIWVHDFNDQVAPATIAQLRQNANCREIFMNENTMRSRWYSLNAATLPLSYVSSVTSATGPKWRQWYDTSASTVPHYGLKYAVDGLYTGMTILLEAKYVMEFKGVS